MSVGHITSGQLRRVAMGELRLLAVAAEGGPAGGPAAFQQLEQTLPTVKGRRFYGVVKPLKDGLSYHAAAETQDEHEAAQLALATLTVPAGDWMQYKMLEWPRLAHTIGATAERVASLCDVDANRPTLEFYRSERELRLLIPVTADRDLQLP